MPKTFEITCPGYAIFADLYEGKNQDHIILILPGFRSYRARQPYLANTLTATTGANVIAIDYSGHGDSPFELKDTRPAQQLLEVVTTFDWIKAHYPTARISVVGNSYGSFLAAHLTQYRSFDDLVLRAPAIYKPEALYDLWSVRLNDEASHAAKLDVYRHDTNALQNHPTLQHAPAFTGRTLVAAHGKDEVIPEETSTAYTKAFKAESFVAAGFPHSIGQSNTPADQLEAYTMRIASWLK